MSKAADLVGPQDQGGKQGGQAGIPAAEKGKDEKTGLLKAAGSGEVVGNPTTRKP